MRQAKVKPGHALRCAIYSCDAIVWNAIWQWGVILIESLDLLNWTDSVALARMLLLGIVLTIALTSLRLIAAYRHYMKFPHVLATVGLSQLAVVLLMCYLISQTLGFILFR
jgi:uncharacterized membrane protein